MGISQCRKALCWSKVQTGWVNDIPLLSTLLPSRFIKRMTISTYKNYLTLRWIHARGSKPFRLELNYSSMLLTVSLWVYFILPPPRVHQFLPTLPPPPTYTHITNLLLLLLLLPPCTSEESTLYAPPSRTLEQYRAFPVWRIPTPSRASLGPA